MFLDGSELILAYLVGACVSSRNHIVLSESIGSPALARDYVTGLIL